MNIFSKRPLIEVISTSPFDSKIINDIGANRIELVSALEIGGLTPSSAIIRKCLEVADIPTMVMVRHHNQGFILNS
jgi:copper homeostasis protein